MIVDPITYRRLSGDLTSYDGEVNDALAAAQRTAEQFCGREFDLATRTESVRVFADGRAYPASFPIQSVVSPANVTIDGAAVVLGWFGTAWDPAVNWLTPNYGLSARHEIMRTITYVGGYAVGNVPPDLTSAVCRLAANILTPAGAVLPDGVTSVSVGDLSITSRAGFDSMTLLDSTSASQLTRFRKPELVR
jgi:hypothetical protein